LFCWVAKEVNGSLEDGTAGWAEGDDGHAAKNNYLNTQADCTSTKFVRFLTTTASWCRNWMTNSNRSSQGAMICSTINANNHVRAHQEEHHFSCLLRRWPWLPEMETLESWTRAGKRALILHFAFNGQPVNAGN